MGAIRADSEPLCAKPGWFPVDFGLKDHAIFWNAPYYYLISTYLPSEDRFAYARSLDLCNWETLQPVLSYRAPGTWDEYRIWAPFVLEQDGVYYLYYTGVTQNYTQSILFATTTNPADPTSWREQGMIFQPAHLGMDWLAGSWADCRDPYVIVADGIYYLYYTGHDQAGGIVGMASAQAPGGPWQDWGAVLLEGENTPESPMIIRHGTRYYLFYHHSQSDEYYRIGATPAGPWDAADLFIPGWAHESWRSPGGEWYTSYLTDYTVSISPLSWDTFFQPPHPFIGGAVYHIYLPSVKR